MKTYLLMVHTSIGKLIDYVSNFDSPSINGLAHNCLIRHTHVEDFMLCVGELTGNKILITHIYSKTDDFYINFVNKVYKLRLLE